MTKFSLITILISVIFGCQTSVKESKESTEKKEYHVVTGKKFFDYDQIDYYHSNFDSKDVPELVDDSSISLLDSIKISVLLDRIPISVNDTSFINNLTKIDYTKKGIAKEKFSQINSIFIEKTTTDNVGTMCVYVYRDILVFKKQNKITGIAKICFRCGGNYIVGTNGNTVNFGQDGDYEKLKSIIYK